MGRDINVESSNTMTSRRRRGSMEVSAHDGDFKAVVAMIESGVSVNERMDKPGGGTALHQAAFGNKVEVADFLIKQKADIDSKMDDGRTPLLCCTNGDGARGVAKLLLEAKCDVTAVNKIGITALDLCVRADGQDELETLLREYNVPAKSKMTNWREKSQRAVSKVAVVTALSSMAGPGKPEATSDSPKSPLSPSQRFKKDRAERALDVGGLSLE